LIGCALIVIEIAGDKHGRHKEADVLLLSGGHGRIAGEFGFQKTLQIAHLIIRGLISGQRHIGAHFTVVLFENVLDKCVCFHVG
jgi:hypothetical protein